MEGPCRLLFLLPKSGVLVERVVISKRGSDRLRSGHPWIYRSDLTPDPGPSIENGSAVEVVDAKGRLEGTALYSVHSQIALRLVSRGKIEVDRAFFEERLGSAASMRERVLPDPRFCRIVHGEADFLPGLVVDRYGDHLSVQILTPAMEARKETIFDLLEARFAPKSIVERNDVRTRTLEGLEVHKGVARGTYEGPVTYVEGEALLEIDLLEGQKTGTFLDQKENHLLAGTYARGKALDLFSYVGGFALQLAKNATSTKAVEISAEACGRIRRNAELSKVSVEAIEANVFDWLRDEIAAGARYDTIALDPPAFAKSKATVDAALRGYKEVNLRALQLLAPGGILITSSCSYHVSPERFEQMVMAAARDSKRDVQVLERRGAGRDHPTLLPVPETWYLKCLVLRAV